MNRKWPYNVRKQPTGRFRVYVDGKYHPPEYDTLDEATHAADDAVIEREKLSDTFIDTIPLNYPDEWPPYNVRRKQFAIERGNWEHLYGGYAPAPKKKRGPYKRKVEAPVDENSPQGKFEKRWLKYEGDPETERILPGGKDEWMELGASVEWDLQAAIIIVGDRYRDPNYNRTYQA